MAHNASSLKRARKNVKNRTQNRAWKSLTRTAIKRMESAVKNKDPKAGEVLKSCVSSIDKAVSAGALHRNTVARRKARLYRIFSHKS